MSDEIIRTEVTPKLIEDIRLYILSKTGILYFKTIKRTADDLMVTCPFHKKGQETKPSCGIKIRTDEKGSVGTVHCFSCGQVSDLDGVMKHLLGEKYNANEVESLFHLSTLVATSYIQNENKYMGVRFEIPKTDYVSNKVVKTLKYYHPYLKHRRITEEVAGIYDIGYDKDNEQITFPIRDINRRCLRYW